MIINGNIENLYVVKNKSIEEIKNIIKEQKQMIFYLNTEKDIDEEKIIKEKIIGIGIFNSFLKEAYYININEQNKIQMLKEIFEESGISKISIDLGRIYILLKQEGIQIGEIKFDCSIAAYILNPTNNKLSVKDLSEQYLDIDVKELLGSEDNKKEKQYYNIITILPILIIYFLYIWHFTSTRWAPCSPKI